MDSSNVPRGGPKNPTQSSNLREPTTIDMGLFDESDEDEQPVGSSTAAPNSHGYDYDNVDDEDPLAVMPLTITVGEPAHRLASIDAW